MGSIQWTWYYPEVISVANSNLIQLIKRIALEAVIASKPCDVQLGNVKSVSPLNIAISQKMVLDEDFLIISDTVKEKIKKDATVIVIRHLGGQQFVVIDTVAE